MLNNRSSIDNVFLFFKGLSMGAANKVPGVSGGMVAFVLDFYEELIYSFQKINLKAFKLLVNRGFKPFYRYVNGRFLLLVMGGSVFSYFSVSILLDYLIRHYELYVWSWFFGMILGSIYYIGKDFNKWTVIRIVSIALGMTVGIAISFMSPATENDNLWFVFFCGIIGVSGMTLPGLSGSFILILMGNYVLLLVDSVTMLYKTITDIFTWNWEFINDPNRIRYLKIVGVFTAGSVFGLVSISHILSYVLKRWNHIVTAVILGFITGSLGNVWPWKKAVYKKNGDQLLTDMNGDYIIQNYKRYIPEMNMSESWIALGYIVLGIGVILFLDYYSKRNKINENA